MGMAGNSLITDALHRVVALRESLTEPQAQAVMQEILRGEATDAQIAGLLVALSMKGETVEEIVGFARAIRGAASVLEQELISCYRMLALPITASSTRVARGATLVELSTFPPQLPLSLPGWA